MAIDEDFSQDNYFIGSFLLKEIVVMIQEEEGERFDPANDDAPLRGQRPPPSRIGDTVIRIARLIGRQMARDAVKAQHSANDNQAVDRLDEVGPQEPKS
jgi:hypothetical protein